MENRIKLRGTSLVFIMVLFLFLTFIYGVQRPTRMVPYEIYVGQDSNSIFPKVAFQTGIYQLNSKFSNNIKQSIINIDEEKTITCKINVNEASKAELTNLPRIGKKLAQNIVEYREKNNHFNSVDELVKVQGIGTKTLENIRPYCFCDTNATKEPLE